MALSLAILMLFLALGSGTAVWAAEATGSSTLEQHLEKRYVTQQDLQSAPHNVETEDAAIPAKYFEFVCVNHHADGSACTDLQTDSISSIKGGRLRNNVPLTLQNKSDVRHTFSRAHIGNTAVYFVGTLTIHEDDGTEQEYVYYTTDKNVTNKTVYAVLKSGDKITLEYTHGKDHTVEYQFKDSDGNVTSEGPDGWSLDQVFGADRPLEVANGHSYSDTVTIPRGYPTETVKTLAGGNPLTYAEGESLQCSGASIAAVQDCLYYDRDKDRKILTLRAVWKARKERDAIPYMVNFYVSYKENGETVTKKIKSRTHMVNPGARVVADLYQYEDGKKQLSANIQNVLSGDNETGSAYDGEYRIDDEKTTKGIDNVTVDNNTVDIYLVKVEKEDPSKPSDPVTPTDPSKPTDPSQLTDSSQQTTSAATSSAQSSSQQTADDAAATGDNFAPVLWIAIAAAALAGIGVVLAGSRRKKQ